MTPPTRPLALLQAALGGRLGRLGTHGPAMLLLLLLACLPVLAGAAFVATFLAAPLVLLIAVGESAQNAWARLLG
jgi:hypothetical protein